MLRGESMKDLRLVRTALVLLGLTAVLYGQESDTSVSKPRFDTIKIEEFARASSCDLSARVDNMFIQLNNDPDSTAYVITYSTTDVLPSEFGHNRMLERVRQQMAFRKYDESRIRLVDGGFREEQRTEFYIVPLGGVPPEPSETITAPKMPKTTFLWARGIIGSEESWVDPEEFVLPAAKAKREEEERLFELKNQEISAKNEQVSTPLQTIVDQVQDDTAVDDRTPEEIENDRFTWIEHRLSEQIAANKGSHGVIIFYADDQYYDVTKLKRFIEQGRDRMAKEAKLRPDHIGVVFGGYHGSMDLEFWLVPKDGKEPKPQLEEREVNEENSASPDATPSPISAASASIVPPAPALWHP